MVQYKSKLLKSGAHKGKYRYTRTLYSNSQAGVPEKPVRRAKKKKRARAPAPAPPAPKVRKKGKKRRLGSKRTTVLLDEY